MTDPPPVPDQAAAPERPPIVALRTYTAIRMGVVAVIFALGVAVAREIHLSYNAAEQSYCVQRSLSAYFYTPVRPVFVGTLLIIAFAMIVMWGKTVVEDAALNLGGLLIAAVALVPTLDSQYCSLAKEVRDQIPDDPTQKQLDDAVIAVNGPDVQSNFFTYLVTLVVILAFVLIAGVIVYLRADDAHRPTPPALVAYAITWLLAAVTVAVYIYLYRDRADPGSAFNHKVHGWSANLGVFCVIVAVMSAAADKVRTDDESKAWWHRWDPRWLRNWWMWGYGALALAMVAAAAVFKLGDDQLLSGWSYTHRTFLLEAIVIFLLAVYWVVQTIDRWGERAPKY